MGTNRYKRDDKMNKTLTSAPVFNTVVEPQSSWYRNSVLEMAGFVFTSIPVVREISFCGTGFGIWGIVEGAANKNIPLIIIGAACVVSALPAQVCGVIDRIKGR